MSQTRQKVVDEAKNDLPHLEETLRSLKIMQKIAEDPKNDDMFGHWLKVMTRRHQGLQILMLVHGRFMD